MFGVFDYDIPVNKKSGITIIIGENGLGKTILLEMLEALFEGEYIYFRDVSFKEFILEFDDGVKWILKKEEQKEDFLLLNLTQIKKDNSKPRHVCLMKYPLGDFTFSARRASRHNLYISRNEQRMWKKRKPGEIFYEDKLINWIDDDSLYDIYLRDRKKPQWFTKRHENVNVSLIKTQRLISIKDKEEGTHENTVEKLSKELSKIIKSLLTKSTELSSKLDRTYPNRLVNRLKPSPSHSTKQLKAELALLETKRKLLDRVGLIVIEKDSNILDIETQEDVIDQVLLLYVEDSFKKIEIFDEIAKKIEILLSIINKRFKHKKFFVDREQGFLFRSTIIKDKNGEGQSIPVSKLSSGEQNELVLFYELLFKSKPSSLILIDEPEVSLHISWQNCFIEDLKEIATLNNLRFIIATHSPDIISNNWDLKVELKGLE